MTFEQLLIFFMAIVGLAYVIQAVAMLVTAVKLDRGLETVKHQMERLQGLADDAFKRVTGAVAGAQPLVDAVQTLDRRSAVLLEQSLAQVRKVDERIDNTLESGREKLQDLNRSLDDVFDRMQEATTEVQQLVLRPSLEIAAVAKGIRSGLQTYLKRRVSGR